MKRKGPSVVDTKERQERRVSIKAEVMKKSQQRDWLETIKDDSDRKFGGQGTLAYF